MNDESGETSATNTPKVLSSRGFFSARNILDVVTGVAGIAGIMMFCVGGTESGTEKERIGGGAAFLLCSSILFCACCASPLDQTRRALSGTNAET